MPPGETRTARRRPEVARIHTQPRPPRLPWRATTAVAAVAAIVTVCLAGCSHASSTAFAHLTVDGQAQVIPATGSPHGAHSGDNLSAGDRVQVTSGQVAVHLHSGVLQLRAGSLLIVDDALRLLAGPVLIQPTGRPLQVAALDGALVVPSGVAQLAIATGGSSLTAKVYQATAQLEVTGNAPESVAAPREVTIGPDSPLPVAATPLRYQDSDPWDHLFLAPAEAISAQLAAAAAGFDAQVPANQGTDATFYQRLVPSLSAESDFASAFDAVQHAQPLGPAPAAKPGDYLITTVIALRGTRGTFSNRLHDELVFSAQGAPWGFVAYDQGVNDLTAVLNDVLAAIGRASLPFTGPPGTQIALGPPTTAPPTTRPSRPATTTPTTASPNPGQPRPPLPTPTTTTTAPPPAGILPVPVLPGPLGQILNPLLDPLIQALNNILGGKG
jgi:hypothetical protein